MKTKTLLFLFIFLTAVYYNASAQAVLLKENLSSTAWEAELLRLNPGAVDGVPINPNAPNPDPYATPDPATTGATSRYLNLNSTDLYFDKYRLFGAIEVLPVLPSPLGEEWVYDNNGAAVAFRLQNTVDGQIEFPELPSAGTIAVHIRNGNAANPHAVGLEKFEGGIWLPIHVFDLQPNSALEYRCEVLTFEINSSDPIKLRLINNAATPTRFINLYGFEITSHGTTNVPDVDVNSFRVAGRRLIADQPSRVSVYNILGVLVFESHVINDIELPASIGHGVFVVKHDKGAQKIILNGVY
jgi:hypothetical protein